MLLTVAVPCYNMEKLVDRALMSLCSDELVGAVEVIAVNDGSQDKSLEVMESCRKLYPDIIRIIDKPNGGHGSAVNAALEQATGKYFRIVDADDYVDTEALTGLVRSVLANTDADMVVDEKHEVRITDGKKVHFPLPESVPKTLCRFSEYSYLTEYYMLHTVSMKTELLKKYQIKLLENTFYVDFEYILKATSRVDTVQFTGYRVYYYSVGNIHQSVSHESYAKRIDQHRRVTEECLSFLKQGDYPEAMREYVQKRCCLLIHTHLNIALLYEKDRRKGRTYAMRFYDWLKKEAPDCAAAVKKRYALAMLLNLMNISDAAVERLRGRKLG